MTELNQAIESINEINMNFPSLQTIKDTVFKHSPALISIGDENVTLLVNSMVIVKNKGKACQFLSALNNNLLRIKKDL